MPKFLGLDKKKWLWVGVAAAAVVGYLLLSHRGGGSAAPADGGIDAGGIGPPPPSNPFPNDGLGQAAAGYSQQLLGQQQDLAGAFFNNGLYQAVAGGFVNTGKKNPSAAGTFISNEQATMLGPQNKGPLAHGQGSWLGNTLSSALSSAASAFAGRVSFGGGGTRSAASYGFPGISGSSETPQQAYSSIQARSQGRRVLG